MRRRQMFAEQTAESAAPAYGVSNEPQTVEWSAVSDPVSWAIVPPIVSYDPPGVSCPKCHKQMPKRGAHFHIKACKGG